MGAYTSWGAFALTHHFLVQHSYFLACQEASLPYKWYENYELLGDDVVLWGDDPISARVAELYLQYMEDIGCEINLHKSVNSDCGVFEFAKRLMVRGSDVACFSWKSWEAGGKTIENWVSFIAELQRRGHPVTLWNALTAFFGELDAHLGLAIGKWPRNVRKALVLLTSPVGPFPLTVESWGSLFRRGYTNVEEWIGIDPGLVPVSFDTGLLEFRELLHKVQEEARLALITSAATADQGWKALIGHAVRHFMTDPHIDLSQKVIWEIFSVHPWLEIVRSSLRGNFRKGLDIVYAPLIQGGMQTASWWQGEDLPEDWDPHGAVERSNEWRKAPLEELLKLPVQDVVPYALPIRIDEKELEAKASSLFVLRVHNTLRGATNPKLVFDLLEGKDWLGAPQGRRGNKRPST
jgi:hypothetical protein